LDEEKEVQSKYKENENNKALINNRLLCIKILIKASEIRIDMRANNFLTYFKQEY